MDAYICRDCGRGLSLTDLERVEHNGGEPGACYCGSFDVTFTPPCPKGETVKRVSLWGEVTDTYRTEAELNGFRASQGALL